MPCRSYPLGWHADELEHKGFDAACLLQSEGFCVQPAHKELVEVLAMASGIAERRIIAVSSRKTVFSAMKDLGSLAQPKPLLARLEEVVWSPPMG